MQSMIDPLARRVGGRRSRFELIDLIKIARRRHRRIYASRAQEDDPLTMIMSATYPVVSFFFPTATDVEIQLHRDLIDFSQRNRQHGRERL